MKMEDKLFIHKFQPIYFDDFGKNNEVIDILKTLVLMDNLNILLLGNIGFLCLSSVVCDCVHSLF
jgi:hypothetical protein